MDLGLAKNLIIAGNQFDQFMTVLGRTISTDDFYEGQGRLDGAICEYKEEDKMNYLREVAKAGVKNMEMEALVFGALTHMAGVRSAVVCVTLLDRLKGDQITTPKEELLAWQTRPMEVVARFILSQLSVNEKEASMPAISKLNRASSNHFVQSQSCFEDV